MKLSQLHEAADQQFKVQKTVTDNIDALVEFARSLKGIEHGDVNWKGHTLRVWTRGDGSRYKEPLYVSLKNDAQAKRVFDLLPGKEMKVSGEFGSSAFSPAKKTGGFLFVLRDNLVHVSTDSVLRNSSVWRSKKD